MTELGQAPSDLDLTIFVACYDEEANIIPTLETLRDAMKDLALTWEAIVIDDGSRDRSVALVADYIQTLPELPIRLVVNEANRGLAENYIEGSFLGRGRYYRLVCGDDVEDAQTFRQVFSQVGKADMVLFYHNDNRRTLFRKLVSRMYTGLINLISGHSLHYYNGCAIHLRYNVMRWHTNYHGFGFQADLICRLIDEGFNYIEVPIKALERPHGRSKAFTARNLLSVAHTMMDLAIRRVGRLFFRKVTCKALWHERTDLYAVRKGSQTPEPSHGQTPANDPTRNMAAVVSGEGRA